jgi:hypothetical protein
LVFYAGRPDRRQLSTILTTSTGASYLVHDFYRRCIYPTRLESTTSAPGVALRVLFSSVPRRWSSC